MKNLRLSLTATLVLLFDRVTKTAFRDADRTLIPRILALHGTRNTGMAFGLLAGHPFGPALIGILLCAAMVLYLRKRQLNRLCQYGAGLLLGGALGNLLDRIFLGYVIDFIDPVFLDWFVFNIADAGVTCGTALLMIHLLFGKGEETHDRHDR